MHTTEGGSVNIKLRLSIDGISASSRPERLRQRAAADFTRESFAAICSLKGVGPDVVSRRISCSLANKLASRYRAVAMTQARHYGDFPLAQRRRRDP